MTPPPIAHAARLLALAVTALLVMASPASAHPPTASFTYAPEHPVGGERVYFTSTSVPAEGHETMVLEWDLDNDGEFDDAIGEKASYVYENGTHTVRLRAWHPAAAGFHEAVAARTFTATEGPTPTATPTATVTPAPTVTSAPNQPPVAAINADCRLSGVVVICYGTFANQQEPHTIDASPSHDPDGTIARYDWDLDGDGTFETTSGANPKITHTWQNRGTPLVKVRVTDDRGATAEASQAIKINEPSCRSQTTHGRLRATGTCLRPLKSKVNGQEIVRWTTRDPVTINGFTVIPASRRTFTIELPAVQSTAKVRIYGKAQVRVPVEKTTATIVNGDLDWTLDANHRLTGFKPSPNATVNGLKVTGIGQLPQLTSDGSSRFELRLALPAQFGGATSDKPVVISPGKARAAAAGPLKFEVRNASIGPVGLERLTVSYDGIDLWEIGASVKLPPPVPYTVSGEAGIRAGKFEYAGAAVDFGSPGVGPLGPVFLQRISFRIEIKPKKSKCVPKTGIEIVDNRKLLHQVTGRWYDVPNFQIDHGIPTFALCGDVKLTAGPRVLGAAAISLDAGLGLATYNDRPAVFRALGNLRLVEIPVADAALELHTNGYTRMNGNFRWGVKGFASLRGRLMFELLMPKFNATAYVDACLDFVDWCAGARAVVSTKGIAACLKIDLWVTDWTPGIGYRWGAAFPTLYFSGCDIGPYKEHIKAPISQHITTVGRVASKQAPEQAIDLPAGLPGAAIVVKGAGAPPNVTLVGPKGERITTPATLMPETTERSLVMKDPNNNLTQFAVVKPSAGRWRVVVEPGSVAVTSVASAEGLERPQVSARV